MRAVRTAVRAKRTSSRRAPRATAARRGRVKTASARKQRRAPARRMAAARPSRIRRSAQSLVRAKWKAVRRKKTSAPETALKIPALLLEGDLPAPPPVSGPGGKFTLGPTPPQQRLEAGLPALPEAYGTKQLHLTARD